LPKLDVSLSKIKMSYRHEHTLSWKVAAAFAVAALAALEAFAVQTKSGNSARSVIECRGTVKPRRELILRLRPGERVVAVTAAAGEIAGSGASLAEVFDGDALARLDSLEKALLERELAARELELKTARLAGLNEELKAQLTLWQEIDTASAERRTAALRDRRDELAEQVELVRLRVKSSGREAPVFSIDHQIKALQTQLASSVVRAPFHGRVAFVAQEPMRLGSGETLLEFWDTNVVVRAEVLQHQLVHLAKSDRAEVSVEFSGQKPVPATIESVDARAQSEPGDAYPKFIVTLALEGSAHHLVPGMRVLARMWPETKEGEPQ
jgi:hypothetical protein